MTKLLETLKKNKIYAIIRETEPQKVYEIAEAVALGGIKNIEISVLNQAIFEVIENMAKNQDLTITAGSVITADVAKKALRSGAKVISSPVYQTSMIKLCLSYKTPLILSASTANEAYKAWQAKTPIIKLFPAKALGGTDYLFDILRQMPFLNLLPCGSIKLDEIDAYLKSGACAVGVGRALYENTSSAAEITERVKNIIR